MLDINNLTRMIDPAIKELAKKREQSIVDQLNDFISRGLIVIEEGQSIIIKNADKDSIEIRKTVKLVLKDKEYIEKLEKENQELKSFKEKILNATGQQ